MYKAGAIISIIAGIFGVLAAVFTLFFGGLAGAFNAEGATTVVGLGWGGMLASMLVIVFGAVAFAKPYGAGIGLVVCSIAGIFGGGTFVAVCMGLSLIGGILCIIGAKSKPAPMPTVSDMPSSSPVVAMPTPQQSWSNGRMALYGFFSFFAPLIGVIAGIIGLTKEHTRKQGAILLGLAVAGTLMYASLSKSIKKEGQPAATVAEELERSTSQSFRSEGYISEGVAEKHEGSTPQPSGQYSELEAAKPISIKPTGELAAMFNLLSDNTDLQRENKLNELKNKVVEWQLTVYEVSRDGDGYEIQTGDDDEVGAVVHLKARNNTEKKQVEAFKTGDPIFIKGVIKDTFMRNLVIEPAILFQPGSARPVAVQASQTATQMPIAAQASTAQVPQQNTGICSEIYKQEEVNYGDNDVICSNYEFDIADKELNGIYKTVMASLAPERKSAFKSDQVAWIKLKEKQCDEAAAGTINYRQEALAKNQCLNEMTKQRIAYLKSFQ